MPVSEDIATPQVVAAGAGVLGVSLIGGIYWILKTKMKKSSDVLYEKITDEELL